MVQFDEWFAVNETFNVESWEGDEVGFVVRLESVDGVTNLFDLDCAGEGCFLRIVALKLRKAYVRTFDLLGSESHTSTPCLSFAMQ